MRNIVSPGKSYVVITYASLSNPAAYSLFNALLQFGLNLQRIVVSQLHLSLRYFFLLHMPFLHLLNYGLIVLHWCEPTILGVRTTYLKLPSTSHCIAFAINLPSFPISLAHRFMSILLGYHEPWGLSGVIANLMGPPLFLSCTIVAYITHLFMGDHVM